VQRLSQRDPDGESDNEREPKEDRFPSWAPPAPAAPAEATAVPARR